MKCSDDDDDCNLKATLSSGYKLTKYAIVIIVLNKLAKCTYYNLQKDALPKYSVSGTCHSNLINQIL